MSSPTEQRSMQASLDSAALKLSVQSLQMVYGFIIASAIGIALTKLVVNPATQAPDLTRLFTEGGLLFASFIATVVPFFHGMNRHLDDVYALRRTPKTPRGPHPPPRPGAIMLDLFVFVVEAGLLYLLASAILNRQSFFLLFSTLLGVDVLWAFITWLITRSKAINWVAVNIVALLAVLVGRGLTQLSPESLLILLTSIVLLRAVCDYLVNWQFYFPLEEEAQPGG
jgi:hypothetical protein